MRMKSYFADSFQAAMEQARREMGSEAVLVTSRTASADARHMGAYEVVFATEMPESVASGQPAGDEARRPAREQAGTKSPGESIVAEIQGLRRELEAWRQTSLRSFDLPHWVAGNSELENLFTELVRCEVHRDIAQQLLTAALRRLRIPNLPSTDPAPGPWETFKPEFSRKEVRADAGGLRAALIEEIEAAFQADSSLGVESSNRKIVALVGPPGAGKTATIAKLAVKYGLASRRPTMLLSLDTLRVAASEQLRWYASILSVGFQVVETNRALAQALEEHRNKGLIFIDTPGFTLRDLENGCDAADFLASRDDIQTHLVLPASMRSADLSRVAAAYGVFKPSHFIFTRMDETETVGPVLCEAVGRGRPISFFGTGQRVPEDLEEARQGLLGNRLLAPVDLACSVLSAA